MRYAIETFNLSKKFKCSKNLFSRVFSRSINTAVTAVDNLNIQIKKGELFGILGPNGSGKTTLIKLLATLIFPSSGTAYVNGYDIAKDESKVRNSLGLIINEERSFYWRLTGRQNLEFFSALFKLSSKETKKKISELVNLLEIEEYLDNFFYNYSAGIKQKFCIARSLLNNPSVFLMDEPTKSLDISTANNLRRFIKEKLLFRKEAAVLFTTHNYEEAVYLSDRFAFLEQGRIKMCGDSGELKEARVIKEIMRTNEHNV